MFRPWAFWRRVQYGLGSLMVVTLIGTGLYYIYGYQAPNCFDGVQNADERGVDCGGACKRICEFEITAPKALWSESFKIVDGQYNAVAYIENRNTTIGSPTLHYTFTLLDEQGTIIKREGTTVLPPDGVYPIFEGRLMTGARVPTKTIIEFTKEIVWLPAEIGREQFTLEKRELLNADSKPKLNAQLRNNTLDTAQDVEVIATIFDSKGRPLTAARTFVNSFAGRSVADVVFTWPQPIAKTLRSCETPTDVVLAIDLSGSMNNDGGTPPEPVTSVLSAAQSFVTRLRTNDQGGIVTYATNATLVEKLTSDTDRIAGVVSKLAIDPKEERGSTNIGDAFKKMREELGSERHSEEARKVAILLTDGLATAPAKDPEIYAETEAAALKDIGVTLFTVGLGAQANDTFLRNIASSDAQYYKAPSIRDLGGIYASITKDICEDGPTVIEIIPKAETSFTPLQ